MKENKTPKKKNSFRIRLAVMLIVALIIAIGYFTAVGIGNLSGMGFDVFSVLCPLGYLESILASKTFVPRALISFIAVVVLGVVLGRVFCGWICPMPFLQKLFPGIGSKKKAAQAAAADGAAVVPAEVKPVAGAKPNNFKFDSRFGVLIGALGSAAIFGFPVFCLICPVGLSFAVVYLIMRLFAFGEITWTVIVVRWCFWLKWCSSANGAAKSARSAP